MDLRGLQKTYSAWRHSLNSKTCHIHAAEITTTWLKNKLAKDRAGEFCSGLFLQQIRPQHTACLYVTFYIVDSYGVYISATFVYYLPYNGLQSLVWKWLDSLGNALELGTGENIPKLLTENFG